MKVYPIRNGEIFEPKVTEERTNKHRKEKEQECNCNRPYEIELTEQEYIQTCNHKELTEMLFRIIVNGSVIRTDRQYISEWLKQPHTKGVMAWMHGKKH